MTTRIDSISRQNGPRTDSREWQSYSTVMLASSLDFPPRTLPVSSSSAVETPTQPPEPSLFSTPAPRLHEASSSSASAATEPSLHAAPAPSSASFRGGLTPGMVAGIVVGSLLATVIVASLACIWCQERRRQRRAWRRARGYTSSPLAPVDTDRTFAPPPPRPTGIISADRLATPDPNAWLTRQDDVGWDPRNSESSTGFRSPTPRPAVAEVRSFTRAGRKPRIYDVARARERSKLGEGDGNDAASHPGAQQQQQQQHSIGGRSVEYKAS